MIVADALTKQFGGRTVVSDVSFRCEPGTITGFLGPNGARKSWTPRYSAPASSHTPRTPRAAESRPSPTSSPA